MPRSCGWRRHRRGDDRDSDVREVRARGEHGVRVGIDIGGTFTDLVLIDARRRTVTVNKVLTTPRNPAVAVAEGFMAALAAGEIAPLAKIMKALHEGEASSSGKACTHPGRVRGWRPSSEEREGGKRDANHSRATTGL